ncbi:MAG: GreA/GreB family elongation factor [Cytophagales bacterium]|nr:GreA/GreB family elongation factor [Cytophagales bacterium]
MNPVELKMELHEMCLAHVEERMKNIHEAIKLASEAAREETKSSAGDKYETGRAMMQIEIDQQMQQLAEAEKLKKALNRINPRERRDKAVAGSLVITSTGTFYLSISLGRLTLQSSEYIVISPLSPIAQQMLNKAKGDTFGFQGKTLEITGIY